MTDDLRTELRPAVAADAAAIAQVHMESRAVTMPFLPPQKHSPDEVRWWVENIVLVECRTWVAVRGGEVIGYAALDGDLLDQLYLDPAVRRQGIGTRLLDAVKQASPDGLSLFVFQRNTDARAFYERHGFTVVDTDDGSRNMENEPDMTLRWVPGGAGRTS